MNQSSLFQEANQFILPQTKLFDFFDYLAGQKLQIQEDKPLSQQIKITYRHIDTIPKKLYQDRKFDSKDQQFKPIFLREVHDELKQDTYPIQQMASIDFKDRQFAHSVQKHNRENSKQRKSHNQNQINLSLSTQRKKVVLNSLSTNRNQSGIKNHFPNSNNQ